MSETYKNEVMNMLADKLGIEVEEINQDAYFQEDLNLGELELLELVTDLEDLYEIDLSEEKDNIETVSDLLNAVGDKLE